VFQKLLHRYFPKTSFEANEQRFCMELPGSDQEQRRALLQTDAGPYAGDRNAAAFAKL
jgi:hypothetical protein